MAATSPTVQLKITGARGESLADLMRRTGLAGTAPTATNEQALRNYANVIAPIVAEDNPAFKGDPGGNVMAVGPFAALGSINVPEGTDRVRTSDGADYIADSSVNQAYVDQYPRAAKITANGRGFRLALNQRVTVQMFAPPNNGTDDDAPAIRAALAYLKSRATPGGHPRAPSRLNPDDRSR
jgi:hypothetical protein